MTVARVSGASARGRFKVGRALAGRLHAQRFSGRINVHTGTRKGTNYMLFRSYQVYTCFLSSYYHQATMNFVRKLESRRTLRNDVRSDAYQKNGQVLTYDSTFGVRRRELRDKAKAEVDAPHKPMA